ncbi:MAG: DUF192 domain-containing protein [Alphaproteobacteria bacterium]|nr:DUF192 domain-containing protein [Alphaproteobacteria bacterium]MBU1525835.1 DUF192 domain-containing protein [Alphaproteobacteria bacterium]MBU2117992.1 DUF192 domain-containing protein [Alphaproteobacteria bacterium]MBU2350051.1 DUF192 domain-containing protein [Alphaproteobacteria bacterium]MBU2383203.1 DUF192 domain-containing protein [Alphaproteobacteria bacterium]
MIDRRWVLAAGLATALGACAGDAAAPKDQDGNPLEQLTVVTATGEHAFWVEIADDDEERQRGLMFRQPLADDRGMLFQFPEAAERGFWMRNTPSPLDIVYIGADGRIVSIARHTTPYSESTYPSNGPAKGVLETRAGRMDEIGAQPGDQIRHPFFGS